MRAQGIVAASRESAQRAAWAELGARQGLRFRAAAVPGHVGELNGVVQGHRVLVRPDRPALYVEYRFRVAGLAVSTLRPRVRPPDAFATGDAAFDRAFPDQRGSPAVQAALRDAASFRAQALALLAHRRGSWAEVTCDAVQLTLAPHRGSLLRRLLQGGSSLTPPDVAALLPEMVSLVEALEDALRQHALRVAAGRQPGGAR